MSNFHHLQFVRTIFLFPAMITIMIKSATSFCHPSKGPDQFPIKEVTIDELQAGFKQNKLTSRELVEFYVSQIKKLNPTLRAVIEVNPDALEQAQRADKERRDKARNSDGGADHLPMLHGIPILLKDSIATKDMMNTTAGSFALLGKIVAKDAGVVQRLRQAGAIIPGKASLSEWAHFRSSLAPSGWCARTGQGKATSGLKEKEHDHCSILQNPHNLSADPCGSSSGSAIAAAANIVAVTLGTETDGSILCPSTYNSVVGIKPTVGFDADDYEATKKVADYIPRGGYAQFLKPHGLQGKSLGIVRNPFFNYLIKGSLMDVTFKRHLLTLRESGAVLLNNLEIPNIDAIISSDAETTALHAEFKLAINSYLKQLVKSPVRSLADLIQFNKRFAKKEKLKEYGQDIFIAAEATNGIGPKEKKALSEMAKRSRDGFEKVMKENKLDAIVTPNSYFSGVLAIGGFPGINVPAGYDEQGVPFGICFGGLTVTEPTLIEIAYAFEQATKIRNPPPS
ncbi:hypothetical protein Cgig2_014769 [Carnegiea gigantea]|uniref:Amidase domain-containing protein n=1 Tax=Carnegiea gigantea TaxID=171969 RepID=A0A9Q1L254_9CARY|nr:hypothetical protein Cgig2_014769 [Carnegiea gigantea]